MPFITVLNPKGGVGKTTLSLNLGLLLSHNGHPVSFIDLDAQRSLTHWIRHRPKALDQYDCFGARIDRFDEQAFYPDNHQHLFIVDSPAALDRDQVIQLFSVSDVVLIPALLNPVDLHALSYFLFHLGSDYEQLSRNTAIGLIANKARLHTHSHHNSMKKIDSFIIPVVGTIRDTQNYTIPAARGMGLIDLPPWRVKRDVEDWQGILGWVENQLKYQADSASNVSKQ